jgi:hypothetical protein
MGDVSTVASERLRPRSSKPALLRWFRSCDDDAGYQAKCFSTKKSRRAGAVKHRQHTHRLRRLHQDLLVKLASVVTEGPGVVCFRRDGHCVKHPWLATMCMVGWPQPLLDQPSSSANT